MKESPTWKRLIRITVSKRHVVEQVDDELRHHIESLIERHVVAGKSEVEARRAVLEQFKSYTRTRSELTDRMQKRALARGWRAFVEGVSRDARVSWRQLMRRPGFSATVVLTLGLGIGVSLGMLNVLEALASQALPFHESDRLVMLRGTDQGSIVNLVAGPDYYDYRDRADAFQSLASILAYGNSYTVTGGGDPERVDGTTASVNLLTTLRVQPQVGRGFLEEDGLGGARDVVLIGQQLSVRRFGSPANALGQSLSVNGTPYTIVGVLPAGFRFWSDLELWLPMRPDRTFASDRLYRNWIVLGRLAEGSSIVEAQSQIDLIAAQLREAYPETNQQRGVLVADLKETLLEDHRTGLLILIGAVTLVLVIACANVTGMQLARAPARSQELAVRAALGAGRARLCRQLLLENVVLAAGGGLLGYVTAFWFRRVIVDLLEMERIAVGGWNASPAFLVTAVALTVLVGLISGMYPAVRSARADLAQTIKESGRQAASVGNAFRSALVVAQVALSILLLVGAGLLIRSLASTAAQEVGIDRSRMITFDVSLPISRYEDAAARSTFFTELNDALASIPSVQSVAMSSNLPIRHYGNMLRATVPEDKREIERVFVRGVLPGYFETMGIPILMGRGFREGDGRAQTSMMDAYLDDSVNGAPEQASRQAVVSESLARVLSPNGNALGTQFDLNFFRLPIRMEVVGVVGDVRMNSLEDGWFDAVYVPYYQFATPRMGIGLRSDVTSIGLAGAVREAVWNLDENLTVDGISTLERDIAASVADRRLMALAVSVYAVLPLLLAGVGLYAIIAYYVAERSHEIGIRMTLGADAGIVSRLVLWRGARLVTLGVVIGLLGAFWLSRLMRGVLFGVEPTDAITYVTATAFVLTIAVLACAVPTWRAARSDPCDVLRSH